MTHLHLLGKTHQSSLVQSLSRLARIGLVSIDHTALHNAPRYSLTPTGIIAIESAHQKAQEQALSFDYTLPPQSQPPVTRVVGDEGIVLCPICGWKGLLSALEDNLRHDLPVTCEGCGRDLTRLVRDVTAPL